MYKKMHVKRGKKFNIEGEPMAPIGGGARVREGGQRVNSQQAGLSEFIIKLYFCNLNNTQHINGHKSQPP